MKFHRVMLRLSIVVVALVMAGGCATLDQKRQSNPDPNDRLDTMLRENEVSRLKGSECQEVKNAKGVLVDCQRVQREVDRLYTEFPEQERVIMANAVLHYEAGRYESAQFLLDQLLSQPGRHPEAAILRARISVAEGNLTGARILLQREIALSPEYADLRDALASVYYLEGNYIEAEKQLSIAGLLGAPEWRLVYHRGLLKEARGQHEAACNAYEMSVSQKPDFRPARARLLGMIHYPECKLVLDILRARETARARKRA